MTTKQTKSSKPTKTAKTAPKEKKVVAPVTDAAKPVPKKRPSRAKPKPTRAEMLGIITDGCNEIKQILLELKEDETRIQTLGLKKVPELLKETISNMQEDLQELEEEHKELLALPESQAE